MTPRAVHLDRDINVRTEKPAETNEAVRAITQRVRDQVDELGLKMAARYREQIVDYVAIDDDILYGDVVPTSLANLHALLANLERGDHLGSEDLEKFRASAVRRVHQGVSLEAFLHAYRLWGQLVWDSIVSCTRAEQPEEREAALRMAAGVMEHLNLASTAAAQAYLDEAEGVWSDRELVRRELLEGLIAGSSNAEDTRLQAAALQLELATSYVVVVVSKGQNEHPRPMFDRAATRQVLDLVKSHLVPVRASLLVGLSHGRVVILYPAEVRQLLDRVKQQSARLADALRSARYCIGIGGWHEGIQGVANSYAEAVEAFDIAARMNTVGRAIAFDDVIVGHVLRSSPKSRRLLEDTLKPLKEYDRVHSSNLVATLQEYVHSGFNLTKAASTLCVHPNTVVYRLKRIKELTGRDPTNSDQLLLLSLGIKVAEFNPPGATSL